MLILFFVQNRVFKMKVNLYKIAKFLFSPIFSILYKIKVVGLENVPNSGRVVLCSNHISNMDPVLLAIAIKRQIFFMAKEELFKNKFLGNLIKNLGGFPIKRGNRDISAIKTAQNILRNGNILGIFIEGTRSKTGELLKPKPGAIILAKSTFSKIIPICIKPENCKKVKLFKRLTVIIGKPILPDELGVSKNSSKEIRDASRLVMNRISELREKICKLI